MRARNRGKRLYRCGECGVARFVHWTETDRAGRVRCAACGSARMGVSQSGADANAEIRANAADVEAAAKAKGTNDIIPRRKS